MVTAPKCLDFSFWNSRVTPIFNYSVNSYGTNTACVGQRLIYLTTLCMDTCCWHHQQAGEHAMSYSYHLLLVRHTACNDHIYERVLRVSGYSAAYYTLTERLDLCVLSCGCLQIERTHVRYAWLCERVWHYQLAATCSITKRHYDAL